MALRFHHLVIDCHEPRRLASFWAEALGYRILLEDRDGDVIVGRSISERPGLCFLRVDEDKVVKNRLHIDLDPQDRDAEVERLLELGARLVDVGQDSDASWTVLADPEGNEFCVLSPQRDLVATLDAEQTGGT